MGDGDELELVLIRGLPGAGKSTFARHFEAMGWAHFETDQYFMDSTGAYGFDPAHLGEAHAWCQQEVEHSLATGQSTAVSNTFVTRAEMVPYVQIAARFSARVTIVTVEGRGGSRHAVPESVMAEMKANWEAL